MIDQSDVRLRRATRLATRAAAVTLVILTVSLLAAPLASASAATLQAEMLTNPVPGWSAVPSSAISGVTSEFTKSVQTFQSGAAIAIGAWAGPGGAGDQFLLIRMAQFSGSSVPSDVDLTTTVTGMCASSQERAGATTTVSGIPGSVFEACQGGTTPISSVAWSQGNVLAWVASEGLSAATLDQIARSQAAKLPAGGSSSSSGSLITGIVVIVVIAAGVVVIVNRRRSKAAAVAAAPAGAWLPPGGAAPQWGQPGGAQVPYAGEAAPYAGQAGEPGQAYGAPGGYEPGGYQPPPAAAGPAGYEATQVGYASPASPAGEAAPYGAGQPAYEPSGTLEETQTVAGAQAYQGLGASASPSPAPAASDSPSASVSEEEESPGAEGWYPIAGDTNRQRYWDGTAWTSKMRWDGHAWVNES